VSRKKLSKRDVQIGTMHRDARDRAREKNLPFNVTAAYLRSIATDECPVFKTVLDWGHSGLGPGKTKPNGPQLDRIIPELGYVEGNVAFISRRANRIKDNGTMEEHYAIADWIWDRTHPDKESIAPIPEGFDSAGEFHDALGALLAARIGEDDNDTYHHCGADAWEDADYCTEESCGDCLGCGSEEVGTLTEADYFENIRVTSTEIIRLLSRVGYLYRKFRECRMANGTECEVSEPSDRREQQIQGFVDQAVQGLKKTSQDLFSQVDPNWYADAPRPR
jgi:hypothetical protein